MKVGEAIEGVIEGLGPRGLGWLKVGDVVVRIAGAAPGDRVEATIEHLSPHRAEGWARLVRPISRAADFQEPACLRASPLHGDCGGCPWMHLTPRAQAEVKRARVEAALQGRCVTWHEPPERLGYRNRANFVVGRDASGALLLGSYVARSHDVASMEGCLVHRPAIERARQALERWLRERETPAHPEPGGLRYVTMRANQEGALLVEIVSGGVWEPEAREPLIEMLSGHEGVVGVSWSVNDRSGNAIHVSDAELVSGEAELRERVGPLSLSLAARSFSQLHSAVAAQMYARAAQRVEGAQVVWDLYCGSGGLGLTVAASHEGATLWGAEVSGRAIERARALAAERAQEATFEVHDLRKPWSWDAPKPDVILVNPPRRGLSEAVLQALAGHTGSLVYMSCNEASMARDAAALEAAGWRPLGDVDAFDMLPGTTHVELLGCWVCVDDDPGVEGS